MFATNSLKLRSENTALSMVLLARLRSDLIWCLLMRFVQRCHLLLRAFLSWIQVFVSSVTSNDLFFLVELGTARSLASNINFVILSMATSIVDLVVAEESKSAFKSIMPNIPHRFPSLLVCNPVTKIDPLYQHQSTCDRRMIRHQLISMCIEWGDE